MKLHEIAWAMSAVLVPLWGCAEASDAQQPTGPGGSGGASSGGASTGGAGGQGGTAAAGGLEGGAGGQAGGGAGGGGAGGEGGAVPDTCGNGTVEAPELCDGTDFDGKTCADFGLASGTLVCNAFCGLVLSGCTPLETCNDQIDNDGDGLTDCQDDDCASEPACTVPCFSTTTALVPGFDFGETMGAPNLLAPSCTVSSGPEVVLEVVAPQAGDLGIQLNGGTNFSLSVRQTCDDAGTELGCVNAAGAFGQEVLNVPVTAGETYYIVVDGVTPADMGWFDVFLEMVLPETNCQDFVDNDFDGFVDCDDPTTCKGTAQCTPGASPTGAPCASNTSCAANGGDPACLPPFLGYSGGYCSEFCDLASNDCTGDAVCVDLGISANGLCMDGCTTGADCRPGYVCTDQGYPSLVCAPPGELSCNDYQDNDFDGLTDCEDPTSCKGGPSCTPGPGATGSPCLVHNQCSAVDGEPLCISEFQFGWPSGYCSEFCNFGPAECSTGSMCVNWFFFPSNAGTCLQTCVLQDDCGPGFFCADLGLSESVCIF